MDVSPLSKLPPELRLNIYEFVVKGTAIIIDISTFWVPRVTNPNIALTRVCKQLRDETEDIRKRTDVNIITDEWFNHQRDLQVLDRNQVGLVQEFERFMKKRGVLEVLSNATKTLFCIGHVHFSEGDLVGELGAFVDRFVDRRHGLLSRESALQAHLRKVEFTMTVEYRDRFMLPFRLPYGEGEDAVTAAIWDAWRLSGSPSRTTGL
jgi:hypothetical protein